MRRRLMCTFAMVTLAIASRAKGQETTITGTPNVKVTLGSGSPSVFRIFNSSSVDLLHVQSDGMVGIGASSPTYQLHVRGVGAASDGIYVDESLYTNLPNPATLTNKVVINPRGV